MKGSAARLLFSWLFYSNIFPKKEQAFFLFKRRYFGRKTEKASEIDGLQLTFDFYEKHALNEAEHILDSANAEEIEPDPSQSVRKRTKRKGKRLSDLQYLETVIDEHTIPEEAPICQGNS